MELHDALRQETEMTEKEEKERGMAGRAILQNLRLSSHTGRREGGRGRGQGAGGNSEGDTVKGEQ